MCTGPRGRTLEEGVNSVAYAYGYATGIVSQPRFSETVTDFQTV